MKLWNRDPQPGRVVPTAPPERSRRGQTLSVLLRATVAALLPIAWMVTVPSAAHAQTPCADLTVADFGTVPSEPIAGTPATIQVKVINQGTCNAIGFVVQWRPSPYAASGPAASVVNLGAGDSIVLSLNYTFATAGNVESVVQVDTANSVEETNESNNLQIHAVTVQAATVDLSVGTVIVSPNHPVRGRVATAAVTVTNSGNSAAGSFLVSWQPWFLTSPIIKQVSSLGPGASTTLSFDYTYPLEGTWSSTVTVDSTGTVAETNEFNNSKTLSIQVDPPEADLVISSSDITPNNPVTGEVTTAKFVVSNVGNTAATDFRVDWQPWIFGPVLSTQVDGLAAGASTVVSFDYSFPFSSVFDGQARVDTTYAVTELDESNNTLDTKVAVAPNFIDLTVTKVTVTGLKSGAGPVQGQPADVAITVHNNGNTASGPFLVDWNPDAFYVISPSVSTLTHQIDSLGAGDTTVVHFTFSYPKAGNFSTLATVDAQSTVLESNEANNQYVLPVTVAPAPIDLVVSGFTLSPAQPVQYSTTTASITVKNNGPFPAGPFFVEWRLHKADTAFNPTAFVNGLNPGESQTVSLQGTYFDTGVIATTATVDVYNSVVEPGGGELNNTVTKYINVVPPSADVKVSLGLRSYADGDEGLAGDGEWDDIVFAVLDPTATCNVLGQSIPGIACRDFSDNDVADNQQVDLPADPSITVHLTGLTPLVMALGVLEDDSFIVTIKQFLGYTYEYSGYPDYFTFGSKSIDGQSGDCATAPACFRATFTVTTSNRVPPAAAAALRAPASVGTVGSLGLLGAGGAKASAGQKAALAPRTVTLTAAQKKALSRFRQVMAAGSRHRIHGFGRL